MAHIKLNIDLSSLPKDRIYTAKNGKKYISLTLLQRKEADKFGNTHTIALSKTKAEIEGKAATVYVGSGKYVGEVGGLSVFEKSDAKPEYERGLTNAQYQEFKDGVADVEFDINCECDLPF